MTAAVYARLVEQGRATWGATLPQLFADLEKTMAMIPGIAYRHNSFPMGCVPNSSVAFLLS